MFFDINDLDVERLRGEHTISIKELVKKLRSDRAFVFRALYHERARAEEMGNRKKANYQFKVGQDILINQRRHHRNQLGRVGALTPKAMGPFKMKMQITQNTFEIDIPAAVRKKMRTVFHSSDLIPFESGSWTTLGPSPLEMERTTSTSCQRRSRNWNLRYVFQETILRGISPSTLCWISTLGSHPSGWCRSGSEIWP